jgi:flagellin-like protein
MNTKLRKIKNNAKALSPVVASIILIAVTVAVSVAVAAWMGGMTLGFMNTEQLKITNVGFGAAAGDTVTVSVQNTGSNPVTVSDVYFGSTKSGSGDIAWFLADGTTGANSKISANSAQVLTIDNQAWILGGTYQIKLVTSQGNSYTYQASAPSS